MTRSLLTLALLSAVACNIDATKIKDTSMVNVHELVASYELNILIMQSYALLIMNYSAKLILIPFSFAIDVLLLLSSHFNE